jgi:ArsR family transcriptional regulator, lead/cadmium/zinc/bismuth-responsive transcriptional repressor
MGTRIASTDREAAAGSMSVLTAPATGPADPADPGVDRVAEMFKLLGDPTRCRILFALLADPDLRVLDIAAVTATSRTTVSAALRLLRTAGVVIGRREGRTVHYRVADDHVAKLLTVSWQHSSHATVGAQGPGHLDHLENHEIDDHDFHEGQEAGDVVRRAGESMIGR